LLLVRVESLSQTVPQLSAGTRRVGLRQIEAAKARQQQASRQPDAGDAAGKGAGGLTMEDVARIQRDTPREFLTANLADASRALEALSRLQALVDRLLGADGPGFAAARKALENAVHAAKRHAKAGGALPANDGEALAEAEPEAGAPPAGFGTATDAGPPQSRAQALQQLRVWPIFSAAPSRTARSPIWPTRPRAGATCRCTPGCAPWSRTVRR